MSYYLSSASNFTGLKRELLEHKTVKVAIQRSSDEWGYTIAKHINAMLFEDQRLAKGMHYTVSYDKVEPVSSSEKMYFFTLSVATNKEVSHLAGLNKPEDIL